MHSKHVFLFPFRWDIRYADLESRQTSYAKRTDFIIFHAELTGGPASPWKEELDFKTDTSESYNAWTYFYPFVRKAIFPDSSYSPFKQYTYSLGQSATYRIKVVKKGWSDYDKTFDLRLRSVTLNVYDLGIGVLSFLLENETYHDPEDILHINDCGRRLYPQYVGTDFTLQQPQNSFLATSIEIFNIDKSVDIVSDFAHDYRQHPAYLPPHILQLLDGGKREQPVFVAEKLSLEKAGIRIEPVLDDRMFVLCWYGQDKLVQEVCTFNADEYALTAGKDFWYRYIFVDTDLTCPDPTLKKELLQQVTYTRWAPYKTLYGVSRYTFVILTDSGEFGRDVISIHLSNIYSQLVLTCLVQRSALLRFSGEVSYVSRQLKDTADLTFTSSQVQELNSSYIQFDNRFFFREVTAQEQGIELYDKLQEIMRLTESGSEVKREISELNSYVQVASSETQRVSLERLSLLGGLFLVPSFLVSYFGWGILDLKHLSIPIWGYALIIGAFVILIVMGYRAFFSKPKEQIAHPTDKKRTLLLWLLILGLVMVPVLISPFIAEKASSTQPVIDSTASQKIDSLRIEIRLLRQSLKQPTLSKPNSATR